MKQLKRGIIRSVAKNGGVRLVGEDRWYDAADGAYATPDLRGKTVELTLDGTMFCEIREVLGDKDALISRQVAVKAAAAFANGADIATVDELLAAAAKIEEWITR